MIHHLGNGSACSRLWSNLMPCVGLMGGFNVQYNKLCGLKTSNYYRRNRKEGGKRLENGRAESVGALVRMGTYCKAGEDVCSCAHADADHAVDPAEKWLVTAGLEVNS